MQNRHGCGNVELWGRKAGLPPRIGRLHGALLGESALVKQVTLELLLSAYLF